MNCPFCQQPGSGVLNSRACENGNAMRRRRECSKCLKRWTTVERVQVEAAPIEETPAPVACEASEYPKGCEPVNPMQRNRRKRQPRPGFWPACQDCDFYSRCKGERLWLTGPLPCESLLPDEVGVEYDEGGPSLWVIPLSVSVNVGAMG